MELMPSSGRTADFVRVIFSRPSCTWFAAHAQFAARGVCLQLSAYAASPQGGFFVWVHTCYPPAFHFLRLLGVKGWCGPNPPGALKVAVKTLLRSREGSREAGLHVRSRGMVPWLVQGHTWGWDFTAFRHPGRQEITWPEVRGFPCTWGVGFAPPYSKKGSLGSLAWGPVGRDYQSGGSYQWNWLR